MTNIKNCPFCGGKIYIKGLMGLLFFKCKKCGATTSFDNDECNANPTKAFDYFERRVSSNA